MRIASLTPNWNREKFILPHLEMLSSLDKNIVLQGTAPWSQRFHEEVSKPDRSEALIRQYFPQVEIYPACINELEAPLYNQGLEILKDYDLVFLSESDVFYTEQDWRKLIDRFRSKPERDCWFMSYKACSVNYHRDFDHGMRHEQEREIIAVRPDKLLTDIFAYPARNQEVIEDRDFVTVHHFRGFKGYGATDEWINKQNYHWIKCPDEIRNKLEKWWKIL